MTQAVAFLYYQHGQSHQGRYRVCWPAKLPMDEPTSLMAARLTNSSPLHFLYLTLLFQLPQFLLSAPWLWHPLANLAGRP